MFVSRDREKLIQAILYFLNNTKHCHTLKLFKLLNFADFEHFRQTGRTITGLQYKALPKGPVPTSLFEELKAGGADDLRSAISVIQITDDITGELVRREVKPKLKFDSRVLTKRELKILQRVADFFYELKAEDMSEFSHKAKKPWASVYEGGKGSGKLIPPDLVLGGERMIHDAPDIDPEELAYRRELLEGIA